MEKLNLRNTDMEKGNMKLIGLIDFDLLSTKKLCAFNYGVLLTSSYYKVQGSKVRLILNLKYDNLIKYDKIYIFKSYKTKIHPINLIQNYYSLPVEEYGEGFASRPLFPDLPDFIYTSITLDIYRPLLAYINNGGEGFIKDKKWSEAFFPTLLFFENEGEIMAREYPKKKRLLLYDDPLTLFNTDIGMQKMISLKEGKHQVKFLKPIRIGKIHPSHYDMLVDNKAIVGHQHNLYAEEGDEFLEDFIEWCRNLKQTISLSVMIKTDNGVDYFRKRGGKIYERKNDKRPDSSRTSGTDDAIINTTRTEWFTQREFNKRTRADRERAYKEREERRKFLPSEYEKRYREVRRSRRRDGFGR